MAYRDITTEFIDRTEGDANDQVFITVRNFVKVMIESGQGRQEQQRKRIELHLQRVKAKNETNDWNTIEDYDAFYVHWEATKYKRAAEAPSYDNANDQEEKRKQEIFTALDVAILKPVRESTNREYYEEKIKRK